MRNFHSKELRNLLTISIKVVRLWHYGRRYGVKCACVGEMRNSCEF